MIKKCIFVLLFTCSSSVSFSRLPESQNIKNSINPKNGFSDQVNMSESFTPEQKVESLEPLTEEQRLAQMVIQIFPNNVWNPWFVQPFPRFVCFARSPNGMTFWGDGMTPMLNALNLCTWTTGWRCFEAGCGWF